MIFVPEAALGENLFALKSEANTNSNLLAHPTAYHSEIFIDYKKNTEGRIQTEDFSKSKFGFFYYFFENYSKITFSNCYQSNLENNKSD